MSLWTNLNARAKKMSIVDIKLLEIATVCFTVLVIKFAPIVIVISKWWFIAIFFLAILKPLCVVFGKK